MRQHVPRKHFYLDPGASVTGTVDHQDSLHYQDSPRYQDSALDTSFGLSTYSKKSDVNSATSHPRYNRYYFDGCYFCSKSEAACATLLERHVPDFETVEGQTYDVPIDGAHRVDFIVKDAIFEYHPIDIRTECGSNYEFKRWLGSQDRLPRHKRSAFEEQSKEQFREVYYLRRREILDLSPNYHNFELIVATDPVQFLELVINRFGADQTGGRDKFLDSFWGIIRAVTQQNSPKEKLRRNRAA